MHRSDFESLASFIENAASHDRGAAESAVDQIHELCARVAPQGDPTGTLEAAALLLRNRPELFGANDGEVTQIVVRLLRTAGERHSAPDRQKPVVLKTGPRQPIPSELTETSLRLVSDLYLGEILLRAGTISRDQLEQALRFQQVTGDRVGEALVNLNAVTWKQVQVALQEQGSPKGEPADARPSGTEAG